MSTPRMSKGLRVWLAVFSTNGLVLGCGLATSVLTARLLSPDGRGLLAGILFWPQFVASIGLLSLNDAVAFRMSHKSADHRRIVSTVLVLALALAAVVSAVCYVLLPYLLGGERADIVDTSRLYLLLFVPLNFVTMLLQGVEYGRSNFAHYNFTRSLVAICYVLGLAVMWAMGAVSLEHAVWASLFSNLVVTAWVLWMAKGGLWIAPSRAEAGRLLATGLRFHLPGLLLLCAAQADRMAVISLFDAAAVGHYMVALALASASVGLVSATFQNVVFPQIGGRRTLVDQREYLATALRYAGLLLVATMIPAMLAAPVLIRFAFGAEFDEAVVPAMLLLVAAVPQALRNITVQSLRGLGIVVALVPFEAIAIIVLAVTAWPLSRWLGLPGVALAAVAGNTTAAVCLAFYLRRRFDLSVGTIMFGDRTPVAGGA